MPAPRLCKQTEISKQCKITFKKQFASHFSILFFFVLKILSIFKTTCLNRLCRQYDYQKGYSWDLHYKKRAVGSSSSARVRPPASAPGGAPRSGWDRSPGRAHRADSTSCAPRRSGTLFLRPVLRGGELDCSRDVWLLGFHWRSQSRSVVGTDTEECSKVADKGVPPAPGRAGSPRPLPPPSTAGISVGTGGPRSPRVTLTRGPSWAVRGG